jgi:hypothetical protein
MKLPYGKSPSMPWRRRLAFALAGLIVKAYTGPIGENLRPYTQIERDGRNYRIYIQSPRITALLINLRPISIRRDSKVIYQARKG